MVPGSGQENHYDAHNGSPRDRHVWRAKNDWWRLTTGSAAVVCLLIPLSGGGAYFAWSSALVITMLTVGCVASVAFVLVKVEVINIANGSK